MILVCGDVMLDRWCFGEVTRISPEAPVPIFSITRQEERSGAAANVAANVWAMGADLRSVYASDSPKIIKTRLIARGQQIHRIDEDHPQKPVEKLNCDEVSVVIFVDYGKGTLANISTLIEQAGDRTVLVDPKGYDYMKYSGADVLKPNIDEMRAMVGGWSDEQDLERKAKEILTKAEIGALMLTRASEGMSLYTKDGATHIPSTARQVVDVTGAGETAIAALGVGLHRGLSLAGACLLANDAAGIAVGKFGPSVVTKEELEAFGRR